MHLSRPPRLPVLSPLVETVWVYRAAPNDSLELVLPSGRMQLLINLRGDGLADFDVDGRPLDQTGALAVQGPTTRPRLLDMGQHTALCGVAFRPGGARLLVSLASEITDRVVDLDHFWRDGTDRLFDSLAGETDMGRLLDRLEGALARRLGGVTLDSGFSHAVKMLEQGHAVGRVERELDLSAHGLRRLFRDHAGMMPKTFARLERFRTTVRELPRRTSWVQLALDCGYVDQSHLIREFKAFSGTTPARFRAMGPRKPTHYRIGDAR